MAENKELLSVKLDLVFKLIFGDQRNTDILTSFLKSVLDIPEEEYERITVVDPFVKADYPDDKYGILDVKIHTKSGQAKTYMSRGRAIPFGQLNHMLPSGLARPRICKVLLKKGARHRFALPENPDCRLDRFVV